MSVPGQGTTAVKVRLRGHEVVSHTTPHGEGRYCCLVFLFDPNRGGRDLRVFRGYGATTREAEELATGTALRFLDTPGPVVPPEPPPARRTVSVSGREIEIFCDLVGEQCYQAFPFVRRKDGTRALIMKFHLDEAVTARTPEAALTRCIGRLHEHFGKDERGDS
ncbi:MAG TPA: hypothetical protein VGK94_15085 [Candidatus Polarisedimenticolia bacterium]|jgi:hypothetical protein